jgi:hypothetical protein
LALLSRSAGWNPGNVALPSDSGSGSIYLEFHPLCDVLQPCKVLQYVKLDKGALGIEYISDTVRIIMASGESRSIPKDMFGFYEAKMGTYHIANWPVEGKKSEN